MKNQTSGVNKIKRAVGCVPAPPRHPLPPTPLATPCYHMGQGVSKVAGRQSMQQHRKPTQKRERKRTGVHLLQHLVDVRVEGLGALAAARLLRARGRSLGRLCRLLGGSCLCHLRGEKGAGREMREGELGMTRGRPPLKNRGWHDHPPCSCGWGECWELLFKASVFGFK